MWSIVSAAVFLGSIVVSDKVARAKYGQWSRDILGVHAACLRNKISRRSSCGALACMPEIW